MDINNYIIKLRALGGKECIIQENISSYMNNKNIPIKLDKVYVKNKEAVYIIKITDNRNIAIIGKSRFELGSLCDVEKEQYTEDSDNTELVSLKITHYTTGKYSKWIGIRIYVFVLGKNAIAIYENGYSMKVINTKKYGRCLLLSNLEKDTCILIDKDLNKYESIRGEDRGYNEFKGLEVIEYETYGLGFELLLKTLQKVDDISDWGFEIAEVYEVC